MSNEPEKIVVTEDEMTKADVAIEAAAKSKKEK